MLTKLCIEYAEHFPKDSVQYNYFVAIHNSIILETMFYDKVVSAGKRFSDELYLEPNPTITWAEHTFKELYDVYHPVRNAVETLDSIEPIRQYLKGKNLLEIWT